MFNIQLLEVVIKNELCKNTYAAKKLKIENSVLNIEYFCLFTFYFSLLPFYFSSHNNQVGEVRYQKHNTASKQSLLPC